MITPIDMVGVIRRLVVDRLRVGDVELTNCKLKHVREAIKPLHLVTCRRIGGGVILVTRSA